MLAVRYSTIVVDPPWRYAVNHPGSNSKHVRSAEDHYETLTNSEIADLPVRELAADAAHLYAWVTNPILTEQRPSGPNINSIVRGWGFEPKTLLTWVKSENGSGLGWYFRGDTEHVLFAARGNLSIPANLRESNVFRGSRGAHSQKPDSLLDLVERVSPGPYLEMFARRARFGWDYWGDESLGTAELAVTP